MSNTTFSLEKIINSPISYDSHGDIPLDIPFENILPNDISIYFNLDTRIGKRTCQQTCSHCFFLNEKEARNKHISLSRAQYIVNNLKKKGFSIFPRISDSFTNDGEFLKIFPNTNVRRYCYGEDDLSTGIMDNGEIWTSGAALLKDNWKNLLKIGLDNNFGTISITYHGVLNDDLSIKPIEEYPFKNIFYGTESEKVVDRIKQFNNWNSNLPDYTIAIGVTVGRHNNSLRDLLNYIKYFTIMGIRKLRFNCFYDYSKKHIEFQLSDIEKAQFYRNIKWIHNNIKYDFELGISEDFGNYGIEVMDFPKHIGTCQAGNQLFALVPENEKVIEETDDYLIEEVGTLAGCVDSFKPIMGRLICKTNKVDGYKDYNIDFNIELINKIKRKRINKHYMNGCFGPEIHTEIHNEKIYENNKISVEVI